MVRGERFNSITHLVGTVLALIGASALVTSASRHADARTIAAVAVYGGMLVILYVSSTLYHSLGGVAKRVFHVFDHCTIYLLIAGTYTPFTIGILRGTWGWILFGLIWISAILGVVVKAVGGVRFPRLSTALYIVMGWLALIAIRPLWGLMPPSGWVWLLAGGAAYTAGVAFYAADRRMRYGHFLWHMFVLAGTACHFFAVLWYSNSS